MSNKKIFSWLLILFGEAIIITAFILFRGETPKDIFVLNIIISSVVYGLLFYNFRIPWIDLQDKSQKQIGGLGISWFATGVYAILAIVVVITGYSVIGLKFTSLLIIHSILLFSLFMLLLLSRHSTDKVKEVYQLEKNNRIGINEMKSTMKNLKDRMSVTEGLPESFVISINSLEEKLRFISPANNEDANSLECSFSSILNDIAIAVSDFSLNKEAIESNIKKLECIYQNRKNIHSN